jgi:hypothetical protein
MREVRCGLGKFTLSDDDVVMQYDHEGCVVGIFRASDTPTLRKWLLESERKFGEKNTDETSVIQSQAAG